MIQLQTAYTSPDKFRETLGKWSVQIPDGEHKAIAHIFSRYDAFREIESSIRDIREAFAEVLPDVPYVGCSAAGSMIGGRITEETLVVNLTIMEDYDSYQELMIKRATSDAELRRKFVEYLQGVDNLRGVEIISSLDYDDTMQLIADMDQAPENICFFGGVAVGDDDHAPFIYSNQTDNWTGAFALILYTGPNLHIDTERINGWRPIGFPMHVTRSQGDVLYELDGVPAYQVYYKYLKIPNDKNIFYNALEFPFEVTDPDGNSYLRHGKRCTDDGAIVMSAHVPEGSTVRLSYGDPDSITKDIMSGSMGAYDFKPDSMMIFNCLGRKLFWGLEANRDIEQFAGITDVTGFCALGEILRYHGKTYLNNLSCVAVCFREGLGDDLAFQIPEKKENDSVMGLPSRLANFINTMTAELMEANENLQYLLVKATTDALTGIINRGEIERRIEQCVYSTCDRKSCSKRAMDIETCLGFKHENEQNCGDDCNKTLRKWSLIMTDIDDFKLVNDLYSHQVGDQTLTAVAKALKEETDKINLLASVGRWGGEEFMILLPGMGRDEAVKAAEKLRMAVHEIEYGDGNQVSMSFGVISYHEGDTTTEITARADKNLYEAKAQGKDCCYYE